MKIELYIDGSYNKAEPDVTKGAAIILAGGKPILCQRYKTRERSLVSSWNVGGELIAALGGIVQAGEICKLMDEKSGIHIYYDYEGVEKFATGAWRAKKTGPAMYVYMLNDFKAQNKDIQLFWHKVPAHSGVCWNEAVDSLANGITPAGCEGCRVPDIEEIFPAGT